VKPTNTGTTQNLGPFFIKVSALGGSSAFFGPYTLIVGCASGSVTFSESNSFTNTASKTVGDSTASAYTFSPPNLSTEFCTITKNEIV